MLPFPFVKRSFFRVSFISQRLFSDSVPVSTATTVTTRPALKPINASSKINRANLNSEESLKEMHSKITLDTHFGHHLRELGHQRGNRPKNNHLLNGSRTVTEQRPSSAKAATVMDQRDARR